MRNRVAATFAIVGGLSLLATACGGSDDASSDSDGDAAATDSTSGQESDDSTAGTADGEGASADTTSADTAASGDGQDASGGGELPAMCADVDLSAAPDEPVTIRLGRGTSSEEPLYIMDAAPELAGAVNNGTFYNLEITEYSPPDRLAAYQAGELDGGTSSAPQLLTAVANGLNIMSAASIAYVQESSGYTYNYAALEGSPYASGDLEGAKIGIIAPNTSTEYWAKAAVAAQGLDPDRDVSYVAVPPANAEQALRDGQTDIQFFASSFWSRAQAEGGLTTVFDAITGPGFDQELLDLFFDRDWVTDNTEVYCAFISDYQTALDTYVADRSQFAQPLIDAGYSLAPSADAFMAAEDDGRSAGGAIHLDNLDMMIENMQSINFLPSDLDVSSSDVVMDGYSITD